GARLRPGRVPDPARRPLADHEALHPRVGEAVVAGRVLLPRPRAARCARARLLRPARRRAGVRPARPAGRRARSIPACDQPKLPASFRVSRSNRREAAMRRRTPWPWIAPFRLLAIGLLLTRPGVAAAQAPFDPGALPDALRPWLDWVRAAQ